MNTRIRQLKSGSWVAEVEKTKLFSFKEWYAITKVGWCKSMMPHGKFGMTVLKRKKNMLKETLMYFMIEMGFNAY